MVSKDFQIEKTLVAQGYSIVLVPVVVLCTMDCMHTVQCMFHVLLVLGTGSYISSTGRILQQMAKMQFPSAPVDVSSVQSSCLAFIRVQPAGFLRSLALHLVASITWIHKHL